MDTIFANKTIAGLRKVKGDMRSFAEEAGVDYSWLSKFSRGVFPDASGRRVELVYRALIRRGIVEPVINFGPAEPLKDCA